MPRLRGRSPAGRIDGRGLKTSPWKAKGPGLHRGPTPTENNPPIQDHSNGPYRAVVQSVDAHRALDAAIAAAYGWPADLPDGDILARLLALNLERAAAQQGKAGA